MNLDEKISVHIVDDHPIISDSLAEFFSAQQDFLVTGTSADSVSTMRNVAKNPPDIVILDIEIPGENTFELARNISSSLTDTKILFFSAFLTDAYLMEAATLPIFGFLTKSVSLEELLEGIRKLANGQHVFSNDVLERFPGGMGTILHNLPKTRLGTLTPREREVLKFIASDMTGKDIAMKLGLSSRTVDRHKANLMDKLAIHSQVGLTRFAVAEGLCQLKTIN